MSQEQDTFMYDQPTPGEYAITEDEANNLAALGEEVFVVWNENVPNYFNDIDGAYDYADENGRLTVLDYTTGDYA